MTRYVTLIQLTPQGLQGIKKSPARAESFRKACKKSGVKVETLLWTTGSYDGVLILAAKTENAVLRQIAKLAAQGNVKTHTMRALNEKEFVAVVK
jgi:uncharacterized protein with GYD domain